jgi:hypothetical protein
MSNVKILVCVHKNDYVRSDAMYMPIHAGKAISDVDLGFQGDDTGDNISAKNPNYCELTALYWAWKNLKDIDYIGLNHYRRYFKFSCLPFKTYKTCSTEQFLEMKDTTFILDKHLGGHDIILAKKYTMPCSVADDYCKDLYSEDYRLLKKVVHDLFPDYYYSFCNVMEHNNKCSFGHLFITKREIFDDYCKWIFAILTEVEKLANIKEYSIYQARVFAFMAERLLNVYVSKNKLKIKYYPYVCLNHDNSGVSVIRTIKHNLKCNLSFLFSRSWEWWLKNKLR